MPSTAHLQENHCIMTKWISVKREWVQRGNDFLFWKTERKPGVTQASAIFIFKFKKYLLDS